MAASAEQLSRRANLVIGARYEYSLPFAAGFVAFCVLSAGLIARWPIQLSIATVFLFAGPHNWIEVRYFLARMPLRWGRSRTFYSVGLGGVALLSAAYIGLYAIEGAWYLSESGWLVGMGLWNSAVVLWICALIRIRKRDRDRTKGSDATWNPSLIFAIGFALCAAIWFAPFWFNVALVYLHPLVALWFVDRELKRRRPHLRRTYHACLAVLAGIIVLLWVRLASAPNLADSNALSWRITQHAGAGYLSGISSHLLVSTHVFLETVHYGVWLVLIPVVGLGAPLKSIWRTNRIPLASQRAGWPRGVGFVLVAGAFVVLALWASFGVSYATTRDIYFTVAIAHVLAEAPFLIRLV